MLHDPKFTASPAVKELLAYLLPIIIFNDPTKNVHIKGSKELWEQLPHDKSLFLADPDCGFPIGNLTSQLFSNVYLDHLDQFVVRELHIHYYGRYVDDFVIVHTDLDYLKSARRQIEQFLRERLYLTLHPHKVYIQPATHGVEFIGARIYPDKVIPTARIMRHLDNFLHQSATQDQEEKYFACRASYEGLIRKFTTL